MGLISEFQNLEDDIYDEICSSRAYPKLIPRKTQKVQTYAESPVMIMFSFLPDMPMS
jgi:hypothetical protein